MHQTLQDVFVWLIHTDMSMCVRVCVREQTHQPSSLRPLPFTSLIFGAVPFGRQQLLLDFLLQMGLFFGQHFLGFAKSLDRLLGCRLLSALTPAAEQLHQHRHFGFDSSEITCSL